jgi:uncharacterized protein YgiM (DUF1202 family)
VIDAIDSDPDPIDRSFGQEEVARAATDALRSIDFDDEQDTVTRALTITDAQVWKVSSEAGSNVVIENLLDYVVPVVAEPAPKTDSEYRVSVNRANMRNGPSTRNGAIAKLERGTAVRLLPSESGSWVKLRVVDTNRVGWISKKLLKKVD